MVGGLKSIFQMSMESINFKIYELIQLTIQRSEIVLLVWYNDFDIKINCLIIIGKEVILKTSNYINTAFKGKA